MAATLRYLLTLALTLVGPALALSEERIMVQLHSGESLSARVASQTDEARLWLRFGEERIAILRSIPWEQVVGGQWRDQSLSPRQLQEAALSLKPALASGRAAAAGREDFVEFTPALPEEAGHVVAKPVIPMPAASLAIEASLAQWDADTEADGLVVRLLPCDFQGRPTVASGSVDVELLAPRRRRPHDRPGSLGVAVETIARWTVRVDPGMFGPTGGVVTLPFGAIDPQFDLHTAPFGLVRARLAAPGSGVFEASCELPLRPWSFTRDELQRTTGRRFMPQESVGRGAGNILP